MSLPNTPRGQAIWVAAALSIALVIGVLVATVRPSEPAPEAMTLTQLERAVDQGRVTEAVLSDESRTVLVTTKDGTIHEASYPDGYGAELAARLVDAGAKVDAEARPGPPSLLADLAVRLLPMLLLVGVLVWFLMRYTGGGAARFGSGKADPVAIPQTTFADVAGCDETVTELQELVAHLLEPDRLAALGARAPHGVLLVGPPGTGKTLLARAVAGEAGVPFFALSGSDFTEMYVGVGARRVRDLFAKAQEAERTHGGAIVFIDELDACGRSRSSGPSNGATEERESTLNQLLVAMDGFHERSRVIVLAATNRPEILDAALLRPGRFDRQVRVPAPDRNGRLGILRIHTGNTPLADDVDLDGLAKRTAGMTGADLANLVNQSGLAAARRGGDIVTAADVEDAFARVMLGPERRSAVVTEHDRAVTAWHEAGHAVVALADPDHEDPVAVSIVPRGPAGGVTWMAGSDHQFLTLGQARARIAVAMGGRAGEELLLGGDVTQGAASDFRAATDLARRMVADYGMGPLGPGCFDEDIIGGGADDAVFAAVRSELDRGMERARRCLVEQRTLVETLAARLLEEETVDTAGLRALRAELVPSPVAGDEADRSPEVATALAAMTPVAEVTRHTPAAAPGRPRVLAMVRRLRDTRSRAF